jgi:hypothetical protein
VVSFVVGHYPNVCPPIPPSTKKPNSGKLRVQELTPRFLNFGREVKNDVAEGGEWIVV